MIDEMIAKWEKEFAFYDKMIKEDKSETIEQLYMARFETRQIQAFIDDLKKLKAAERN